MWLFLSDFHLQADTPDNILPRSGDHYGCIHVRGVRSACAASLRFAPCPGKWSAVTGLRTLAGRDDDLISGCPGDVGGGAELTAAERLATLDQFNHVPDDRLIETVRFHDPEQQIFPMGRSQ